MTSRYRSTWNSCFFYTPIKWMCNKTAQNLQSLPLYMLLWVPKKTQHFPQPVSTPPMTKESPYVTHFYSGCKVNSTCENSEARKGNAVCWHSRDEPLYFARWERSLPLICTVGQCKDSVGQNLITNSYQSEDWLKNIT